MTEFSENFYSDKLKGTLLKEHFIRTLQKQWQGKKVLVIKLGSITGIGHVLSNECIVTD